MNKAALAADRAVAFDRFNFCTRLDLEFHTPAMAAAHMFNQVRLPSRIDLLRISWRFQSPQN